MPFRKRKDERHDRVKTGILSRGLLATGGLSCRYGCDRVSSNRIGFAGGRVTARQNPQGESYDMDTLRGGTLLWRSPA